MQCFFPKINLFSAHPLGPARRPPQRPRTRRSGPWRGTCPSPLARPSLKPSQKTHPPPSPPSQVNPPCCFLCPTTSSLAFLYFPPAGVGLVSVPRSFCRKKVPAPCCTPWPFFFGRRGFELKNNRWFLFFFFFLFFCFFFVGGERGKKTFPFPAARPRFFFLDPTFPTPAPLPPHSPSPPPARSWPLPKIPRSPAAPHLHVPPSLPLLFQKHRKEFPPCPPPCFPPLPDALPSGPKFLGRSTHLSLPPRPRKKHGKPNRAGLKSFRQPPFLSYRPRDAPQQTLQRSLEGRKLSCPMTIF